MSELINFYPPWKYQKIYGFFDDFRGNGNQMIRLYSLNPCVLPYKIFEKMQVISMYL